MTTLYEITEQHNQALLALTEMEDLPEQVIKDTMEGLAGEFKEKAVSVASFYMNQDADIKAMKEAERRINERRKALEKKQEYLNGYLQENMQSTGIHKIECPYFKISLINNPESVRVVDEDAIPESYKEFIITCKIDKRAIKQDNGCTGAELFRTQSVVIK